VHAELLGEEVRDPVAIGDPQRYVVEDPRSHGGQG
jgi:hypothetical protein